MNGARRFATWRGDLVSAAVLHPDPYFTQSLKIAEAENSEVLRFAQDDKLAVE